MLWNQAAAVKPGLFVRFITFAAGLVLVLVYLGASAEPPSAAAPAAIVNDKHLDWTGRKSTHKSIRNLKGATARFVDADVVFRDSSSNQGTFIVLDSALAFPNGLRNDGALLFDPSTITVSTLHVGMNGYLAETGDPGDRFIITEDFINESVRNTDWRTANTIFQFNGGSRTVANPQTLEVPGVDAGNQGGAWLNNFALGPLEVGTSATYVQLVDAFNNSAGCVTIYCESSGNEALYVDNVVIHAGATLDLNGFNLYALQGVTNNGGSILNGTITVGATTGNGDINDSGEVDVVDVLLGLRHVLGTLALDAGQLGRGDIYPQTSGDGQFTRSDLLLLIRVALGA